MSAIALDHIALAVPRLAEVTPFLVGVLGGVPAFGMPQREFAFFQWRYEGGGRLEVLEPRGDEGFLHRFLAANGPGIHHVTFIVPSLRATCERAEAAGHTVVGYDDSDPRWAEAFLHPRHAGGIVVQLVETTEHDLVPRGAPPAAPVDPPPPVTLLGLRLRMRSRAQAERQWGGLLAGELVAERADGLAYRWPGSPLRLVVEIDATGSEGPACIEIADAGRLGRLDGATTLPGIPFVEVLAAETEGRRPR
jgi:methylmalonyl-CoA/ethylmalonyl-CoA epimerase